MPRLIVFFLSFVFGCSTAFADNYWLDRLDEAIQERKQVQKQKERKLSVLLKTVNSLNDGKAKLHITDSLYKEYFTFRYDSAMAWAEREKNLAERLGDDYYRQLAIIHQAYLCALGGYYAEGEHNLQMLDTVKLNHQLRYEYHMARFWLYMFCDQYSSNKSLKPVYRQKMKESLMAALNLADKQSPEYLYLEGQMYAIVRKDQKTAFRVRSNLIRRLPVRSKLYASTAYDLAWYYKSQANKGKYVEWCCRAAISDMLTPLKENLAIQELAMYVFEKGDNIDRATRYIYVAMEDAQFFGDRLRILEIAHKFPTILSAYTEKIQGQKSRISFGLVLLAILSIIVLLSLIFIKKQNNLLSLHKLRLERMNNKLERTNGQLQESNEKLEDTNRKREGLAQLYIDLCAKYIDKLKKYQTLVKRKIKTNQSQDLLTMITSSRISEEDAATFIHRFDRAFLDLYPSFITEFNGLLLPSAQISVSLPHELTPELRIYALMRLGVKGNQEIADLLFLSLQTIYNYRSMMKGRAIHKETFEEDVRKLCTVIK